MTTGSGPTRGMTGQGQRLEHTLLRVGSVVIRFGLVVIILWIGALKLTAYEAEGARHHAATSPLLAWANQILGVRGQRSAPPAGSLLRGDTVITTV